MSHTPGPWFVAPDGEVRKDEGRYSFNICAPINPDNAALIAAAPDLLEALRIIVECENDIILEGASSRLSNGEYDKACAAIAKAEDK